jgi:alpha-1,2-mannosyltransferase
MAAFAIVCWATLKLSGAKASGSNGSWERLAFMMVAGLCLEPVWHTLFLGQINLFLLAVILVDILLISRKPVTAQITGTTWPLRLSAAGVGIGLAAAIKLTPGIFIVMLLLGGRIKVAATAGATFAGCVFLAYLAAPSASQLYWSHLFYDTGRVGAPYISNQSPFGAAVRILGHDHPIGAWYLLVPLVVGAFGLVLGSRLVRRADWLAGAAVTGTTGLLVSPISWTHHWVWVVPALAVLVRNGKVPRRAAIGSYALFVLAPMWWTPHAGQAAEYGFHGWITFFANSYLLAGVSFLIYMWFQDGLFLGGRATPLQRPEEENLNSSQMTSPMMYVASDQIL